MIWLMKTALEESDLEASLEFLFRADRRIEESIAPHKHQCYELVYYAKGEGNTRIGTADWSYGRRTFAIVRPRTVHDERRQSVTDVICVGFAWSLPAALPEGVFADDPSRPLLPLLERMLDELQARRSGFGRVLDLQTCELAILLERRFSIEAQSAVREFQYTLNYMDEHFTQSIDFRALSGMSGYSYDRYRHLFKEKTGYSPTQYVMMKRLAHARTLLRETDRSISSIAMECGFSSDSQFCSLFKRETGHTPGGYRQAGRRQ